MRIVSWNCAGAFRKKYELLEHLEADLLIIQECEHPDRLGDFNNLFPNNLWAGHLQTKGLGIFSREDVALSDLGHIRELDESYFPSGLEPPKNSDSLRYFIPCRVNDKLNLVGTWACKSAFEKMDYIGQAWLYLKTFPEFFKQSAVMVGDFNSNTQWNKKHKYWNHSETVKIMDDLGLYSLYHKLNNIPHGDEADATFYLHRNLEKPYHIDYAFVSGALNVEGFVIGTSDEWLSHSDHMPLIFNLNI